MEKRLIGAAIETMLRHAELEIRLFVREGQYTGMGSTETETLSNHIESLDKMRAYYKALTRGGA